MNEYPSGIVTYVHHLRTQLTNRGHRVSVFAKIIGQTNTDSGIYLVKPTVSYRIRQKLARFVTERSYDVSNWGQAIAATVNRVSRDDPIDVQAIVDDPLQQLIKPADPAVLFLDLSELHCSHLSRR